MIKGHESSSRLLLDPPPLTILVSCGVKDNSFSIVLVFKLIFLFFYFSELIIVFMISLSFSLL